MKTFFWHTPDCTSESEDLCRIACYGGILGSLLEFVPEIFWAESVNDFIGHNGTINHDKLICMKEILRSFAFDPKLSDHGGGSPEDVEATSL